MSIKIDYSIDMIKAEARELVGRGILGRQQAIYTICQFVPAREWDSIELELELNGFLLRDHIIDLIQPEKWDED